MQCVLGGGGLSLSYSYLNYFANVAKQHSLAKSQVVAQHTLREVVVFSNAPTQCYIGLIVCFRKTKINETSKFS